MPSLGKPLLPPRPEIFHTRLAPLTLGSSGSRTSTSRNTSLQTWVRLPSAVVSRTRRASKGGVAEKIGSFLMWRISVHHQTCAITWSFGATFVVCDPFKAKWVEPVCARASDLLSPPCPIDTENPLVGRCWPRVGPLAHLLTSSSASHSTWRCSSAPTARMSSIGNDGRCHGCSVAATTHKSD